jgi:hypothetical protein
VGLAFFAATGGYRRRVNWGSAVAGRRAGASAANRSRSSPITSVPSVRVGPGLTAFTRTRARLHGEQAICRNRHYAHDLNDAELAVATASAHPQEAHPRFCIADRSGWLTRQTLRTDYSPTSCCLASPSTNAIGHRAKRVQRVPVAVPVP